MAANPRDILIRPIITERNFSDDAGEQIHLPGSPGC